jgi:putative ABC transport system permease protein
VILKQALVRLAAAPMFTIFSVVSLGAGVAVTTAVYSVVDALFDDDLNVADPERVAFVGAPGGQPPSGSISEEDFEHLRDAQTAFSSVTASASIFPSVATPTRADVLAAEAVDGAYFTTLGIGAQVGRVIQPGDEATRARVAVLGDELWRQRFAADPGIVGTTVRLNGEPFEVVGVAAARYRGLFGALRSTKVWIPLASEPVRLTEPSPAAAATRARGRLLVVGRLASDATMTGASAEVATIAARLDQADPPPPSAGRTAAGGRNWSAQSAAAGDDEDNGNASTSLMIVALVAMVLAVACTNLATLVLARGAARQGELAVRMAMGASRGRLVWEQCVESAILAGAGLIAAYVTFQGLSALMTTDYTFGMPMARVTLSIRPMLDTSALGVSLASMLVALAVFGLEPAVQLARTLDIRSALATAAAGVRPRLARHRMVIRWQVAIAASFFIVATMFIRGTIGMARHDSGVELDRIAVATLNFQGGVWDEARIRRTIDRVADELRTDPAVDVMSASTGLPFGVLPSLQVAIATPQDLRPLARPQLAALAVTPTLFRTLGIPIVRGRSFNDSDGPAATPVIVISELTARQLFGAADAVGRPLVMRRGDRDVTVEVIGVARDTDVRFINAPRRPLVYLPLAQHFDGAITLAARTTSDPARAVAALRDAIRRADPDLAVETIGTGRATLSAFFELLRAAGVATLCLGGFTLLLSMVGLFGVQSHLVSHRTREIGVRMSVGATARHIQLMVLRDGYRPVVEGLVLGLWGGVVGRMVVRSYLQIDVDVIDPWMLGLTPIPLILAAFCACYLPASRAAGVDPTVALRAE